MMHVLMRFRVRFHWSNHLLLSCSASGGFLCQVDVQWGSFKAAHIYLTSPWELGARSPLQGIPTALPERLLLLREAAAGEHE